MTATTGLALHEASSVTCALPGWVNDGLVHSVAVPAQLGRRTRSHHLAWAWALAVFGIPVLTWAIVGAISAIPNLDLELTGALRLATPLGGAMILLSARRLGLRHGRLAAVTAVGTCATAALPLVALVGYLLYGGDFTLS